MWSPSRTLISVLISICLLGLSARATLTPTAPGPGDVYTAGGQCPISWMPDTTGTWKNVTIQLMSGQNLAMTPVALVAENVDGTDPSLTPYNWTCPEVDPNSAIYFYQFSQDGADSPSWTARFAISSPDGKVVPPEYATQPLGQPIPWGDGQLALTSSDGTVPSDSTAQDTNSILALPTDAPAQSGFVKVVQPTSTTVLTWVVMPVETGVNGSVMGLPSMAQLMGHGERCGPREAVAAVVALVCSAVILWIS